MTNSQPVCFLKRLDESFSFYSFYKNIKPYISLLSISYILDFSLIKKNKENNMPLMFYNLENMTLIQTSLYCYQKGREKNKWSLATMDKNASSEEKREKKT